MTAKGLYSKREADVRKRQIIFAYKRRKKNRHAVRRDGKKENYLESKG